MILRQKWLNNKHVRKTTTFPKRVRGKHSRWSMHRASVPIVSSMETLAEKMNQGEMRRRCAAVQSKHEDRVIGWKLEGKNCVNCIKHGSNLGSRRWRDLEMCHWLCLLSIKCEFSFSRTVCVILLAAVLSWWGWSDPREDKVQIIGAWRRRRLDWRGLSMLIDCLNHKSLSRWKMCVAKET